MKITPIHYRRLCKVFEIEGFTHARTKGDHLFYVKPGIRRPIVIPAVRDVPVFIIENNIRTAGIDRKRYFKILEKI